MDDKRTGSAYDASVATLDAYFCEQLCACEDEIARFETKYAASFADFAQAWEMDERPARWSPAVEGDYMEWKGLVLERQTLYTLIEAVEDLECTIAALITELAVARGEDTFDRLTPLEIASWMGDQDL